MLDTSARKAVSTLVDPLGRALSKKGINANYVTLAGWLVGVGSCIAILNRQWVVAMVLWLSNRALDGIDGPIARASSPTKLGGYLDLMSDFSIYGGFIAAVAVAIPQSRLAIVALFLTYYLSGISLLALSALSNDSEVASSDGRSLNLVGGIAEGAETVVTYCLFCLFPSLASQIAWIFAAAVFITAVQRFVHALSILSRIKKPCNHSRPC